MDILRPDFVKIGKRNYRKIPVNLDFFKNTDVDDSAAAYYHDVPKSQEDVYADEGCLIECRVKSTIQIEEADEDDSNIKQESNGVFKLELQIPSGFYGHIIGKEGSRKKRLEIDTKTRITIPKMNSSEDACVVIKGDSKKGIISCKNRLGVIISQARQKERFTHFISIPLNIPLIQESFNKFKNDVLKECFQDRGIESSIFQSSEKLHLTICMLTCMSSYEEQKAVEFLDKFKTEKLRELDLNESFKVNLRGLEYMNDDPSAVDVLYGQVVNNNLDKIQLLADEIVKYFSKSGLADVNSRDKVKLHATVMNSRYRQTVATTQTQNRESFDARNILKLFKDFDFGSCQVNEIHVSKRKAIGADGYYECVGKIKLLAQNGIILNVQHQLEAISNNQQAILQNQNDILEKLNTIETRLTNLEYKVLQQSGKVTSTNCQQQKKQNQATNFVYNQLSNSDSYENDDEDHDNSQNDELMDDDYEDENQSSNGNGHAFNVKNDLNEYDNGESLSDHDRKLISFEEVKKLYKIAKSRGNFAALLASQLYGKHEKITSNVMGTRGKRQLSPRRMSLVKKLTFKMYPSQSDTDEDFIWKRECVKAIDSKNRKIRIKMQNGIMNDTNNLSTQSLYQHNQETD